MSVVFLGLGSNLGDRQNNIERALDALQRSGMILKKCSTIIETAPVGGPQQGLFLNAVAQVSTELSPEELLHTCKQIEKDLGRISGERNGPRVIDIDILLFDNITITTDDLTIPHPRMHERAFVTDPLKEIAPQLIQ